MVVDIKRKIKQAVQIEIVSEKCAVIDRVAREICIDKVIFEKILEGGEEMK